MKRTPLGLEVTLEEVEMLCPGNMCNEPAKTGCKGCPLNGIKQGDVLTLIVVNE